VRQLAAARGASSDELGACVAANARRFFALAEPAGAR
jgi:hypothetical protein